MPGVVSGVLRRALAVIMLGAAALGFATVTVTGAGSDVRLDAPTASGDFGETVTFLSLIHISEPTRLWSGSRMPSSA